jgi:hypothetical protein
MDNPLNLIEMETKLVIEYEINWNYTLLIGYNNTMSLHIFVKEYKLRKRKIKEV